MAKVEKKAESVTPSPAPVAAPPTTPLPATPLPATEVAPAPEPVAASPSTALAVAVQEDDGTTLVHLATALPQFRAKLAKFKRPQPEDLQYALNALPDVERLAFQGVMEQMRAEKPGTHVADERFQVTDIKWFHGTGHDESRPQLCPPGGIYSKDGRILMAPKGFDHLNAPQSMVAAVVGIHATQAFWPPRDSNPNGTVPPGMDRKSKTPYCTSLDRVRGSNFGDCGACVYRPWREKGVKECAQDVHLYLILQGFSGLYRMIVSGTSVKTGAGPVLARTKTWPNSWHRFFEFDTKAETNGTNRWFELQTRVATNKDFPQGIPLSKEAAEVCALISAQIDAEIYYPGLAQLYTKSQRMTQPETKADLASAIEQATAAAAAAATPPMADHSGSI